MLNLMSVLKPGTLVPHKIIFILALTFNTIRHTRWSIVLIPCTLNMVTSTTTDFSSGSCVQQRIIPEQLNQIYIAAHRWKEEILSFPMMYHTSKSVICIKF